MKKLFSFLLALLLCLTLAGCSSSSVKSENGSNSYGGDAAAEAPETGDASLQLGESNRKLIYHTVVTAETKEYDAAKEKLDNLITQYQGYLESFSFSGYSRGDEQENRSLNYTIRVPSESLFSFLEELEDTVRVVSSNTDMSDVTGDYVDSEARLNALKKEELRLLELLEQAENLEEILQLEDRISEVRYQIENITSQLQVYDDEIAYSTVELSLRDVTEYTIRPSFGSRSWEAFTGGWSSFVNALQGLVIALLWLMPFLLVGGVIVFFVVSFAHRSAKKRRAKFPVPPKIQKTPPVPAEQKEEPKGKL